VPNAQAGDLILVDASFGLLLHEPLPGHRRRQLPFEPDGSGHPPERQSVSLLDPHRRMDQLVGEDRRHLNRLVLVESDQDLVGLVSRRRPIEADPERLLALGERHRDPEALGELRTCLGEERPHPLRHLVGPVLAGHRLRHLWVPPTPTAPEVRS
jgi:hypothetical protein